MRDKARPLAALAVGIGLVGVGAGFGGAGGSSSATPLTVTAQLTSYTRAFPTQAPRAVPPPTPAHGGQAGRGPAARTPAGRPDRRRLDIVAVRRAGPRAQAVRGDRGRVAGGGQGPAQRQVHRRAGGQPVHLPQLRGQADRRLGQALAERGRRCRVRLVHHGPGRQAEGRRHRARRRGQAGEPAGRRAGHGRHRRRGRGGLGPGGPLAGRARRQRHRDQCAQGQPGQAGRRGARRSSRTGRRPSR